MVALIADMIAFAQIMQNETRVLIVDDEPSIRRTLYRWLTAQGYKCSEATDGINALEMLHENSYDLMISDIHMPRMDGLELLRQSRTIDHNLAVVMITAVDDRETPITALQRGAYGYIIKPFKELEVFINIEIALERRRLVQLSEEYEHALEETVMERTAEIRWHKEEITLRLVTASEYRDEETGLHIARVARYGVILAETLGWSPDRIDDLRLAAPMHDIGKIGIPDGILLKAGKHTPDEWEIMKTHTVIGKQMLDDSRVPVLQMGRDIAWCHHEWWNGAGYPCGLAGDDIPESARITAVADVFEALLSDRIYRPAYSEDEAFAMMLAEKGTHFDPVIIDCMCDIRYNLMEIYEDSIMNPESNIRHGLLK